jgi:hypothetical protein
MTIPLKALFTRVGILSFIIYFGIRPLFTHLRQNVFIRQYGLQKSRDEDMKYCYNGLGCFPQRSPIQTQTTPDIA